MNSKIRWVACGLLAILLGVPTAAPAALIYATTAGIPQLLSFDSSNPSNLLTAHAVSGMQANETLVGIDFRTSLGSNNNQLYGVGSFGRIYRINTSNGAATFVAGLADSVGNPIMLNGTEFGVDFNPTVDRLRIMSFARPESTRERRRWCDDHRQRRELW